MNEPAPQLWTAGEIAAVLRVDVSHVRRLASDGVLGGADVAAPGARNRWRFTARSVREFLERRGLDAQDVQDVLDALERLAAAPDASRAEVD